MNRGNGQKQYYNINTGFTGTEATCLARWNSDSDQARPPLLPSAVAVGARTIPPESTGHTSWSSRCGMAMVKRSSPSPTPCTTSLTRWFPSRESSEAKPGQKNNGYILDKVAPSWVKARPSRSKRGLSSSQHRVARTSLLVVRRGGQINANGTNVQPIIFTSENVWSDRISGDWGWSRRQRCSSDQPEQPDR